MFKLGKLEESCYYRPYFYNDKELHQIIIVDGKGTQYNTKRGWLQEVVSGYKFEKDIDSIEFESELKFKRKIPETISESFLCNYEDEYNNKVLTLFLYAPDLKSELIKENMSLESIYVYNSLTFRLNNREVTIHVFDHSEITEIGEKARELSEIWNGKYNTHIFSSYILAKILTDYDITLK